MFCLPLAPDVPDRQPTVASTRRPRALAFGAMIGALLMATEAVAQRLDNQIAVFAALDKVTATIKKFEVPVNATVAYGSLRVTPRKCYSRPADQQPKTTTFVEVDEVQLDGKRSRLFTGWMFAESPGLNAVEHPVFDVWLTNCKGAPETAGATSQDQSGANAPEEPRTRRRARR